MSEIIAVERCRSVTIIVVKVDPVIGLRGISKEATDSHMNHDKYNMKYGNHLCEGVEFRHAKKISIVFEEYVAEVIPFVLKSG